MVPLMSILYRLCIFTRREIRRCHLRRRLLTHHRCFGRTVRTTLSLSLSQLECPNRLVDCYASYFGALTCVAWSPDGRFVLAGGQDDLITIFSPWEKRVVARCQGHSSFVSAVAFDDQRCDGRTYRFGSVGEDNKLILVCPCPFTSIRVAVSQLSFSGIFLVVPYIDQNIRYSLFSFSCSS